MPLEPGQSLLNYRIVDKLGEGGMGVVWRAVDTTLDREAAIKVLPAHFTREPERLARGPIPIGETIEIAREIAAALEAAHDADVIHRDLKPANVKLTPGGQVKVLDFGLAEVISPETPADRCARLHRYDAVSCVRPREPEDAESTPPGSPTASVSSTRTSSREKPRY